MYHVLWIEIYTHASDSFYHVVTFDKPPDPALIDSATYVDAINYFCDMMMEKALESLKRGGRKPPGSKENVVQAKNTVLVLPKLPQ